MHFKNVWAALGEHVLDKKVIATLSQYGNNITAKQAQRLPSTLQYILKGDRILLEARSLPKLYNSWKRTIDSSDFQWLDLAGRVANYNEMEFPIYGHHLDPYKTRKQFALNSGISLFYHNRYDDSCALYLRDRTLLQAFIQYTLRNFFMNKRGYGFFKQAPKGVVRAIGKKGLAPISADVMSRLVKILFNTGITCFVDDLQCDLKAISLKVYCGLPRLIWEEGHVSAAQANKSFSLIYELRNRKWSMTNMTKSPYMWEKRNKVVHA